MSTSVLVNIMAHDNLQDDDHFSVFFCYLLLEQKYVSTVSVLYMAV